MLIKNLKGLIATSVLILIAGCGSTPLPPDLGCGVPGGLCAPALPNTSAPRPAPPPAEPRPSETVTSPVELYPGTGGSAARTATGNGSARIALLLPLQSNALGQAAEAVRAGFLAGHERDRVGIEVSVIPSGDSPESTLDAYAQAVERNDIIVGPLARSAVAAVAASNTVSKPTLALAHPQLDRPLPPQMLVVGLSLEDEARQVADWAANEHPAGRALVLGGSAPWQQRVVGAFSARWSRLGHQNATVELPVQDGYVDGNALAELRARLDTDRPQLVFAALDAGQLRQVRSALGTSIPTYGVSVANPGRTPGMSVPELDGIRLLDVPWTVQPDHPQVMVYPRPVDAQLFDNSLDMQRLYALGIDAFRVAREVALRPGADFELDGVTGRLSVRMNNGAWTLRRDEAAAVYRDGIGFESVTARQ
ncbi:penicillin-binding protein activator [Massilia niabensis]|uniref:Penicillin-binding protein activator n=1 Tax=Massilia niabensis TaxID=544910 RepID=A0ABW0L3R1_9BURK